MVTIGELRASDGWRIGSLVGAMFSLTLAGELGILWLQIIWAMVGLACLHVFEMRAELRGQQLEKEKGIDA